MQNRRVVSGLLVGLLTIPLSFVQAGAVSFPTHKGVANEVSQDIEDNGGQKLPDKIASSLSDKDKLVAPNVVFTKDGEIKNAQTGAVITDKKIVGSGNTPPDPLAKTNGESFIPVEVGDVREHIRAEGGDPNPDTVKKSDPGQKKTSPDNNKLVEKEGTPGSHPTKSGEVEGSTNSGPSLASQTPKTFGGVAGSRSVIPSSFAQSLTSPPKDGNEQGARWGTYNGTKAFFDGDGQLFAQDAKKVIDVSKWQKGIDWQAVKNSGIEGAIIRTGFGSGGNEDGYAVRNINGARSVNMPFGVYHFSYAEDERDAVQEARDMISVLQKAGVRPSDMALPVVYDLEEFVWKDPSDGRTHMSPRTPEAYERIINSWWSTMQAAGYTNLSVYSYRAMLNGVLNKPSIHAKTHWVAAYSKRPGFNYHENYRGWQYTSSGRVPGIQGKVDLNAFGYKNPPVNMTWIIRQEDIAVGIAPPVSAVPLEYRFMQYNLDTKKWKEFQGWNSANWAGWSSEEGNYWLHVEVRHAHTHDLVGTKTIAFRYQAGTTVLDGTYAGWRTNDILLGAVSNNPRARTEILIYDVGKKEWVTQFRGPWASWKPQPGIYWTHFRVYTSDGRLSQTKTYPFAV